MPLRVRVPRFAQAAGFTLTADPGVFTLTGQDATLLVDRGIQAAPGAFTLTGQDAEFLRDYVLQADPGAFILTGQSANLGAAIELQADPGSFIVTGQDATLNTGRGLAAEPGSFVLAGQDAALTRTYVLFADPGPFIVTGQDATLVKNIPLFADPGAFVVTGKDFLPSPIIKDLVRHTDEEVGDIAVPWWLPRTQSLFQNTTRGEHIMLAHGQVGRVSRLLLRELEHGGAPPPPPLDLMGEPGSFTLTGFGANLAGSYTLTADPGVFALTGQDADLEIAGVATLWSITGGIDEAVNTPMSVLDDGRTAAPKVRHRLYSVNPAPAGAKLYVELLITLYSPPMSFAVGVSRAVGTNGCFGWWPGFSDAASYGYLQNGFKWFNGANSTYGATFTQGDIVSVLLDTTTGALSFWVNGVDQGVAFTIATGVSWYLAVGADSNAGTRNVTTQPSLTYTPPAGYVTWP